MWFTIKHGTRLTTNSKHCVGPTCHGHENYHNNEISKIDKNMFKSKFNHEIWYSKINTQGVKQKG
jgi:hypothetical protein